MDAIKNWKKRAAVVCDAPQTRVRRRLAAEHIESFDWAFRHQMYDATFMFHHRLLDWATLHNVQTL